jgi:tripartite-type tricarboxylate transporter receptor subunit TctC
MKRTIRSVLAACGAALALAAHAAWPEKPITMIVAYSAGGATDMLARAMASHLEKSLGATIVVLNKPGAGGEIGFAMIATAPPDGYTIGLINSPPAISIPIERPRSAFHWTKLDLLGNLIDDPGAFTVHRDSKINSLADLVAEAKKRPGEISVATTGSGSDDHLAMVAFERRAGVKFNHIPFKGGADVRQALAGKQIDVASMNIGEGMQGAKSGLPFKNLAQMSAKRAVLAPDVPTFAEVGYPIEMAALRGMAAPRGLPPDIRERYVKAIAEAVNSDAFRKKAADYYNPIRYLAPPEYANELRDGEAQLKKMWGEHPWTDN